MHKYNIKYPYHKSNSVNMEYTKSSANKIIILNSDSDALDLLWTYGKRILHLKSHIELDKNNRNSLAT